MRWIAWIVMIVTYFAANGVLAEVPAFGDGLVRYGICAILMFFIVLMHELGHAFVAQRVGADVRSIMVWPFEMTLRPPKLGMAKVRHSGDVGGYVAFRLDRIDAMRKSMMIAAAGPLANLGSAMFITVIALTVVPAAFRMPSHNLAFAFANAFATLSVGIGLANLLPFDGSDGMVLWRGFSGRFKKKRNSKPRPVE